MKSFPKCILWSENRTEPLLKQLTSVQVDTLTDQLKANGSIVIVLDGYKSRIVRRSTGPYHVIAVSSDVDHVKSKKTMDAAVDLILSAAHTIDSALKRAEDRTQRLIHNLKSLTAKIGQEIFSIARQDLMLNSPRDMVKYVSGVIRDEPDEAARGLIEILKHQAAQKTEYSAFEKLAGRTQIGAAERHDIHRVIMNVFYLFFGEFVKKKVKAEVDRTRLQALIDYESIHVCIYYIVENASKYTRHGSSLSVTTSEDNGEVLIRFSMESLTILPNEVERIFDEGFSGAKAIESKQNGAGLGLYLARAMARMNGGNLTVVPGRSALGGNYSRNTFVLTLPK